VGLPPLLANLVALPIAAKVTITGVLLIPLGVVMGMPFPTGLRLVGSRPGAAESGATTVEWAWAMNAAASVLGSVLAIVIAINFGMTIALVTGAAAYAGAALFTRSLTA
jgi:hypothetical protein